MEKPSTIVTKSEFEKGNKGAEMKTEERRRVEEVWSQRKRGKADELYQRREENRQRTSLREGKEKLTNRVKGGKRNGRARAGTEEQCKEGVEKGPF